MCDVDTGNIMMSDADREGQSVKKSLDIYTAVLCVLYPGNGGRRRAADTRNAYAA